MVKLLENLSKTHSRQGATCSEKLKIRSEGGEKVDMAISWEIKGEVFQKEKG